MSEDERYSYKLIYGHDIFRLRTLVHPNTKLFTIIRHPLNRQISLYHYIRQHSDHHYHYIALKLPLVEFFKIDRTRHLNNRYIQHFGELTTEEVKENPKQSLATAIKNIKLFQLIGSQEKLKQSMELLKDMVKWRGKISLEKINLGHYKEPSELIQKTICAENQLDIELYENYLISTL